MGSSSDSSCNALHTDAFNATSAHQLAGQFQMFGGTIGDLDENSYLGTTSDSEGLFQAIEIPFTTVGAKSTILLFYSAAALLPDRGPPIPGGGSPRGWGADCGAGSISGGPYHIKLDSLDGAAGKRDNQIMSNAVLPLVSAVLSTTPSGTYSATLDDNLNVGIADAGGQATFKLYGPFAVGDHDVYLR